MKYFYFAFLLCCVYSCQQSSKKSQREYTYFGGEIVNPNTNYVVLFDVNNKNDTLYLDHNNRFSHRIDTLQDGLYSFKHNPEKQIVLLEQGDSILMRLNTLEFDESLVFTGDGAKKNNFLINMFLHNEKKRSKFRTVDLKFSPKGFRKQQDSLYQQQIKKHERIAKKHQFSPLAQHITRASFEYGFYSRNQIYNGKRNQTIVNVDHNETPADFFKYRTHINYNDSLLKRLYAYNRYLKQYIAHASLVYNNKEHDSLGDILENTKHELYLIDSLIQNTYIKNNMFRNTVRKFLLYSENNEDSNIIFKHYVHKNPDTTILKELETLLISTATLKPSKPIPDQELINAQGNTVYLSTILKKPITALYFWSTENKNHYIKAHRRAASLRLMYPDVDFIAVNKDDILQNNTWLQLIKRNQYNDQKEYKFKSGKCAVDELVIHYKSKVILLDNKGLIIKANAMLFSPKLHDVITTYQKTNLEKHLKN